MAYLRIEEKQGSPEVKQLTDSVVIGRSPECEFSFSDRQLSRRHLRLEKSQAGWRAIDLGSRNGTWLRGQQITTHLLRDGDAIEVGSLTLWFSVQLPALSSHPTIRTEIAPADAKKNGPLVEAAISEILNKRDADSVDEDWSEIEHADAVAATVAPPAISAPSQDAAHRKIGAASLWEIAVKPTPTPAPGRGPALESTGPVDARFSNRLLLRFGSDPKLKGVATAVVIAMLLAVGYFWLGATGGGGGRITIAPAATNVQAASHNKNGAFDLPV